MEAATASKPRTTSLRAWQHTAITAMREWESGSFLIAAAPGAGKTRPALVIAREMLKARVVRRVVVVAPTTPLTTQWAAAAGALGVQLAPDNADLRPPADFDGVAITYARVASAAVRLAAQCTPDTLVIADEAHHLGEELAWGVGFQAAFGKAARWLLLSGTPFRSDAAPIPGIDYDSDGVAVPDVAYGYAAAVRDGVCRPVTFIPYDGSLKWRSGDDVIEAGFDEVLPGREASRRYRTAISVDLPDGLPRILAAANEKLKTVRAGGHADAGALCVAADSEHARAIAAILKDVTGKAPTIVLHTEAQAARKLARFTASKDEWIVAVNMVSEGVDIPRLRVGVYATAAKTPLVFRQIVGRFVRTLPGRAPEQSWLYLPGDPVLRRHATDVETELLKVTRRIDDEPDEGFDEKPDRTETERTPDMEFVALEADVAPTSQMSLFGGPAVVTPYELMQDAAPVGVVDAEPEAPRRSVHEERAALRAERTKLVGELSRKRRQSHREVNAWVNRRCGISKVDDATISQLERSVEALLQALTAKR
ncbi:MAG TPA: DEAD/DEAH box helicase family protein [Baekduia sp.]|nr:DEAD/DEAH box helicase family protein [Baekduia sp.]